MRRLKLNAKACEPQSLQHVLISDNCKINDMLFRWERYTVYAVSLQLLKYLYIRRLIESKKELCQPVSLPHVNGLSETLTQKPCFEDALLVPVSQSTGTNALQSVSACHRVRIPGEMIFLKLKQIFAAVSWTRFQKEQTASTMCSIIRVPCLAI